MKLLLVLSYISIVHGNCIPSWGERKTRPLGSVMMILFFVFSNLLMCVTTDYISCKEGDIAPSDPLFLTGQNLTLTCTTYTPHNGILYFIKKDKRFPDKFVRKINQTTSILVVPNLTSEDVESHWKSVPYYCYLENDTRSYCIRNMHVKIDYYPQPVQDVSCIIPDKEWMSCTWDLGVDYKHPELTQINSSSLFSFQYIDCKDCEYLPFPCPNQTTTSCTWSPDNYTDSVYYLFFFTVKNTKANVTTSSCLEIESKHYYKPGPVKILNISSQGARCLTVIYTHTKRTYRFETTFTLTADCMDKKVETVRDIKQNIVDLPPMNRSATVCGVKPASLINVSVTTRLIDIDDHNTTTGFTSDTVTKAFSTPDNVPEGNPIAMFKETSSGERSERSIVVYIQPLAHCQLNAAKVFYELYVNEHFTERITHPDVHFSKITAKSTNTLLQVRSRSSAGERTDATTVMVYSADKRPVLYMEMMVELQPHENTYTVHFLGNKTDTRFVNLSYILCWCQGRPGYDRRGNFSTKILPISTDSHHLQLYGTKKYWFGVALQGYDKQTALYIMSGIHWVDCIYLKHQDPAIVIGVHLPFFQPHNALTVSWVIPKCGPYTHGYSKHFLVSYCLGTASSGCAVTGVTRNVTVSNTLKSYTINDLEAGKRYIVWVEAVGLGGNRRNKTTEPLYHTVTMETKHEFPFLMVAGVFGGVLLLIVIVFCVHYCRKKNEKSKKKFSDTEQVPLTNNHPDSVKIQMDQPNEEHLTKESLTKQTTPLLNQTQGDSRDSGVGKSCKSESSDTSSTKSQLSNQSVRRSSMSDPGDCYIEGQSSDTNSSSRATHKHLNTENMDSTPNTIVNVDLTMATQQGIEHQGIDHQVDVSQVDVHQVDVPQVDVPQVDERLEREKNNLSTLNHSHLTGTSSDKDPFYFDDYSTSAGGGSICSNLDSSCSEYSYKSGYKSPSQLAVFRSEKINEGEKEEEENDDDEEEEEEENSTEVEEASKLPCLSISSVITIEEDEPFSVSKAVDGIIDKPKTLTTTEDSTGPSICGSGPFYNDSTVGSNKYYDSYSTDDESSLCLSSSDEETCQRAGYTNTELVCQEIDYGSSSSCFKGDSSNSVDDSKCSGIQKQDEQAKVPELDSYVVATEKGKVDRNSKESEMKGSDVKTMQRQLLLNNLPVAPT